MHFIRSLRATFFRDSTSLFLTSIDINILTLITNYNNELNILRTDTHLQVRRDVFTRRTSCYFFFKLEHNMWHLLCFFFSSIEIATLASSRQVTPHAAIAQNTTELYFRDEIRR